MVRALVLSVLFFVAPLWVSAETVQLECPWPNGYNGFVFAVDIENETALISTFRSRDETQMARLEVHQTQIIVRNPRGMADGYKISRETLASYWGHPVGGDIQCIKIEAPEPPERLF